MCCCCCCVTSIGFFVQLPSYRAQFLFPLRGGYTRSLQSRRFLPYGRLLCGLLAFGGLPRCILLPGLLLGGYLLCRFQAVGFLLGGIGPCGFLAQGGLAQGFGALGLGAGCLGRFLLRDGLPCCRLFGCFQAVGLGAHHLGRFLLRFGPRSFLAGGVLP